MHFTTLFVLKGEKIENLSSSKIEKLFEDRYCYCCGETTPMYRDWCDWFSIGGRWSDILKAKKGIHGEKSWCNEDEPVVKGQYSIVQISDLTEPIDRKRIFSIATLSKIYQKNDDWYGGEINEKKFNEILDNIDNKKFDGVIALIDCHD